MDSFNTLAGYLTALPTPFAADGNSIDEVAFSEYAIALASELAAAEQYIDINDPIFDIRDTLNRISRSAAGLYKA